jgi:4-amino-4-deoxy-L-arabinose transferase-like glycosyltransferase
LTLQLTLRRGALLTAAALLCALYLADLNGMGLVSKDEPRYADIGRAIARTGDLITPRLSGEPWFEKPPLLYWVIAIGFKAGLGPELAPRLPVALLGLAFLVFYWDRLRRVHDARVASFSTALLATSAGWIALSGIAITDIPLAVFFSASVLLAMDSAPRRHLILAGASLGLAVLAKSLVGLVLFVPVIAVDYRRIRDWLRPAPILVFLAIALPWHVLCWRANGWEFIRVLFVEHQFGRFGSPALQHEQHWWYYLPVLPMLLYPWFPLAVWPAPLAIRDWRDRRVLIPLSVVVFGFVFFSLSVNKLATYLLPLIPSACIVMGVGLARASRPERAFILPLALLGILPAAGQALPAAIAIGIHAVSVSISRIILICAAMAAAALLFSTLIKKSAIPAAFIATAAAFLWLKISTYPSLDRAATARPLWIARHPQCAAGFERGLLYGLNYYAERALPPCDVLDQGPARVVR